MPIQESLSDELEREYGEREDHTDLLHRAACEIEQLRRENEVLRAKVWVLDLIARLVPPPPGGGWSAYKPDILHRLQMEVNRILTNREEEENKEPPADDPDPTSMSTQEEY